MRQKETVAVRSATSHQLHFLNFINSLPSVFDFLADCENTNHCTSNRLKALRDEVYSFYGQENMKEIQLPELFEPYNAPELLFTNGRLCKELNETEIQAANTVLFAEHISPQFLPVWRSYVANSLAPAVSSGLVLPFLSQSLPTEQHAPLSVSDVERLLPVLVNETASKGCPEGSFICGMEAARCAVHLKSQEIQNFLADSYARAAYQVKTSTNALDVIAAEAEFTAYLQADLVASGKVPSECILPEGRAFNPAAQAVFDAAVANHKVSLSKVVSNRQLNHTLQHTNKALHGRAVSIFDSDSADVASSVLRTVLESGTLEQRDHESGGPLIISGYQRTVDNLLALGSTEKHGGDIFIRVHLFVVPPGEWTIYAPGRNVTIEADVLRLEGHLHINVSACHAENYITQARSGGNFGEHGSPGEPGKSGSDSGSVVVRAIILDVQNNASVSLSAVGGNGGKAQQGGNGFKGSRGTQGSNNDCNMSDWYKGTCSSSGSPGGNGNPGTPGGDTANSGDGGNGGDAYFTYESLRGAASVDVKAFVEGGEGGDEVPGGAPGGGGDGGAGGFGTHIWCNRGNCHTDRNTNQGPSGSPGSSGAAGAQGKAGSKGGTGSANITQAHQMCADVAPVGASSAVLRAKLLMLDNSFTAAAELLQTVLSLSEHCTADLLWHPVRTEAGLLLTKLARGEDLFGLTRNFVPALSADYLLQSIDKNLERMEAVATTTAAISDCQSAAVAAQKLSKKLRADVEVSLGEKEMEYKATWERYKKEDQLCSELAANILTAEAEANRQLQIYRQAQNEALRRDEMMKNQAQEESRPSRVDKAMNALQEGVSAVATGASALNFASSIPATAASYAAAFDNVKSKIADFKLPTDTEMLSLDNIQKLSAKVPKMSQAFQQQAASAVRRVEQVRGDVSQLLPGNSGLESALVSTMSDAPVAAQQHPAVQHAFAQVAHALSALEQTVDASKQARNRREQEIAALERITLETLRLTGIAASLNSELLVRAYDTNVLTAANMLTRQATSAVFEHLLLDLDAARRALSAQFLTPIQWSPALVKILSLDTSSSLQHSSLRDSSLTAAMRSELTLLQIQRNAAMKSDRRSKTEVTNLQWSLPVWTHRALQRGEKVTVMLPWDHPSFAHCIRLGVTSVRVVLTRASTNATSTSLLMHLTYLGDSTVRDAHGHLHRFSVPSQEWHKNIAVVNEDADATTAKFEDGLGVDKEDGYAALSPHASYLMRIIKVQEDGEIPQDITDVTIIFDGKAM